MRVFIDYVTLLLLNMATGFIILAGYLFRGLDDGEQGRWSLGFGMVGLVALVFGGCVSLTWPLPGQFSSIYGDFSVLFGLIFLFAGLGMARGWRLELVATYAFPVGLASMLTAVRFYLLRLTPHPEVGAAGFFLTGLAAIFALPTLLWLRQYRGWRVLAGLVLLGIAMLWMGNAFLGMWMHMEHFKDWVPLIMRAK